MFRHLKGSIVFSVVGLVLAFAYAAWSRTTWAEVAIDVSIVCMLAVLEISISFDNAIVNAAWLKKMTPQWQKRFLTWGIAIAVFGMRILLPILLVSIMAGISPVESLLLALFQPDDYGFLILSIHHEILSFGGTFLLLVGLRFFLDPEKESHWILFVERPVRSLARLPGLEIAIVLFILAGLTRFLPPEETVSVLIASIAAIILFILSNGVLEFVHDPSLPTAKKSGSLGRQSLVIFLYLEVLDASFSLDGVVGAFALSQNLVLIALGLGIGAFYVRSFTLFLVHTGSLQTLPYLEHGAFYAIFCLGAVMLTSLLFHIPEYVSGLLSAAFIGIAFVHSYWILKSKQRPRRKRN